MEWTVRIVSTCTWEIKALFYSTNCRTIPSHGNTADIILTVLHRNFLGVDEFLGQVSLPLRDFDVYERPKSNWFSLKCKPGQTKNDYRGEIEVYICPCMHMTFVIQTWSWLSVYIFICFQVKFGFTVKAATTIGGSSIADLNKKNTSSISSLQKVCFVVMKKIEIF